MEYVGITDAESFRLMDILSINDAAALISGASPSDVDYDSQYDFFFLNEQNRSYTNSSKTSFNIAKTSLTRSITVGRLKANIVSILNEKRVSQSNLQSDWIVLNGIDPKETMIDREDLKNWLEDRGVYPPLLFPNGKKDDYMDSNHLHYAPKLAVCVKAWEVAQTADLQGETYKQFMTNWISKNASSYGVENQSVKVFESLASISNWATKGGRAKNKHTLPLEEHSNASSKEIKIHKELIAILPSINVSEHKKDDLPF